MAVICPTIDAETEAQYREQCERIATFAHRLHIDVADGSMTPNKLVALKDVWWPQGMHADIHCMVRQPTALLPQLIHLEPKLVIFHAEAEGNYAACAEQLRRHGIRSGVALLPETPVELIVSSLSFIDHVLIFSGSLGHFGGTADMSLLEKVKQLHEHKPGLEIGWDGGVNADNAAQLVKAGVLVLNVGGAIHRATEPADAYATLKRIAGG